MSERARPAADAAHASWLLKLLHKHEVVSVPMVVHELNCSPACARRWLNEWARQGVCTKEIPAPYTGAGRPPHHFRLAPMFRGRVGLDPKQHAEQRLGT